MTLSTYLTLHHAINQLNINIRKGTKASDDYMHANTEKLFNGLWDLATRVDWQEDLWSVALGGDTSGSWVAKVVDERAPQHKILLLSSCNKSKVIAYSADHNLYGDWQSEDGVKTFHTLGTLGDDLRQIIQSVIREGDFYSDELTTTSPPGITPPLRNPQLHPDKLSAKEVFDLLNVSDAKPLDELPPPDVWMAELKEALDAKYPNGHAGVFRSGSHGQRWQPVGGKELTKNLREYQEEQRSKLPRDAEGNVADIILED